MWKKLKLAAIMAGTLLVSPGMVSLAAGDDVLGREIRIEPVTGDFQPETKMYRGYIGGLEPCDLFSIEAGDIPYDFSVSLYLTNAADLIHAYRYLILEVTVFSVDGNGIRQLVELPDNGADNGKYLTLRNGSVSLYLNGSLNYVVTISHGSYHSLPAPAGGETMMPEFYIAVE